MENQEELDLIERYFRKELNPDESARFNEKVAVDPAFKRKFETEKLLHKALQFSNEREKLRSYAMAHSPAFAKLDSKSLIFIGVAALAVWVLSTFSSGITSLSPEKIKWVGLIVAIAGSVIMMIQINKTVSPRLVTVALLNGLLVFVMASGFDAINQGLEILSGKKVNEAYLVPFTENKPWWPTQSLEDSLEANRKQIQEMRTQLQNLVASRFNAGPTLGFGNLSSKYIPLVIPRSSTVISGATYEAELYLATSPLRQAIEMQVDGKSIPLEADPSGVLKGKVSFTVSADAFDKTGSIRKTFNAEIKLGDSTYRKVVEYFVRKPQ